MIFRKKVFHAAVVTGAVLGFGAPAFSARPLPLVVPRARPDLVNAAPEPFIDLSHAVPASALAKLPPTAEQFRALNGEIAKDRPAVASAKQKSEALVTEAE